MDAFSNVEHLLPAPGKGPRCPKCVHLLDVSDAHCTKCGLAVSERSWEKDDIAPWERPLPGQEVGREQILRAWSQAQQHWVDEKVRAFVTCVQSYDMWDLGIRRLRQRLVEYPDDQLAKEALSTLVSSMAPRVTMAHAQARAQTQRLAERVAVMRKVGVAAGVLLLAGLFFLVGFVQLDGCGFVIGK